MNVSRIGRKLLLVVLLRIYIGNALYILFGIMVGLTTTESILGAFLAFVEMEIIPAWMVMVIIARELVITGIRILALSQKKVLAAELGGKHKTVSQMFAVIAILVFLIIRDSGFSFRYMEIFEKALYLLMLITVGMTLTSGVSYMARNKDIFMGDK